LAHYAEINESNIVVRVIVADSDFINSGIVGDPSKWIQTSYNTINNQHPDNTPLRKNYAGVGYFYDRDLDAFIPPKPYESWILDTDKGDWHAPIQKPEDNGYYTWDETTQSWLNVVSEE
jgi:hypothetical protein